MAKLATKLSWFHRGAAAFAQDFPSSSAPAVSEPPPYYVCPECPEAIGDRYKLRFFSRVAVENGALTAEHVPPKAFGGRELLLTCKQCNNIAGTSLEAHARRRENPIEALRGEKKEPSAVQLKAGGHMITANLAVEGGWLNFDLPPAKKHANDPRAEAEVRRALKKAAREGSAFNIAFHKDLYLPRSANVTFLRHAYLVLFAIAGYRYIFSPGMDLVRRQIKDPEQSHIPVFLAVLPEERPWSERRIIAVERPAALRALAVQVGRYIAFLPKPGDVTFYQRLASEPHRLKPAQFSGQALEWPTAPLFGLRQ